VLLSRPFLGLKTKTETCAFRSRDRDMDKMNSSALKSRDHGLEITALAASIIDIGDRAFATNYGNRATGVYTKHAVSRPRPILGLDTKTESLNFRSRDRERDLDKTNSSALESRDHGLEITTLAIAYSILLTFLSRVSTQYMHRHMSYCSFLHQLFAS